MTIDAGAASGSDSREVFTHDQKAALAEALRAPQGETSLEAMLQAARAYFMGNPGDDAAKRVVEALELFLSQVWFGGTDDADPRYATAAQHLEKMDFERALELYEAIAADEADTTDATRPGNGRRLARQVRLVMAARAGDELPPRDSIAVPPSPVFNDVTRIAEDGELPLNALTTDEEVTRVASETELPLEALRREVEKTLEEPPTEKTPAPPPIVGEPAPAPEAVEPAPQLAVDTEPLAPSAAPEPVVEQAAALEQAAAPAARPIPRVPAQTETRIPRPGPPRIAPESSFTPLPSLPTPSEPPLGRAPDPVGTEASAAVPASASTEGSASIPPAPAPTAPISPPPAPSAAASPFPPAPAAPASVPPVPFKGVVKDAPRSTLPSVPPPVVHAPEIVPRGTVPPAPPKPAPAEREELPFSSTKAQRARSTSPPPEPSDAPEPRGPAVPSPPPALRAPVVPPPSVPELMLDGVHAPVDTGEITLPEKGAWTIREPGSDDDQPTLGEPSWVGVPAPEPAPAFEPSAAPLEADTWDGPTAQAASPSIKTAEALLAQERLGEALRMYQELAISHPERPELWDRVAEIARLLQQRQP